VDLRTLQQFNERASRLERSRFLKWLLSGVRRPQHKRLARGDWLAYSGLRADDLDAFCFNLRLLIQDKDGISLACVGKLYDAASEDYETAKTLVRVEREKLKRFLDERSPIQFDSRHITNQQFFNTVFYGGLAHSDRRYETQFKRLTSGWGMASSITFFHFSNVLLHLRNCIVRVAAINRVVLVHEQKSNRTMDADRLAAGSRPPPSARSS
jgi:hypothetical protein